MITELLWAIGFINVGVIIYFSIKAYKIYRLLKKTDRDETREITRTKQSFKELVAEFFPEENKRRKVINKSEL